MLSESQRRMYSANENKEEKQAENLYLKVMLNKNHSRENRQCFVSFFSFRFIVRNSFTFGGCENILACAYVHVCLCVCACACACACTLFLSGSVSLTVERGE